MKKFASLLLVLVALGLPTIAGAQTNSAPLTDADYQNALKLLKKDIDFAKIQKDCDDAQTTLNSLHKAIDPKLAAAQAAINMKVDALTSTGMNAGEARAAIEANDAATMDNIAQLKKQLDDANAARAAAYKLRGQKLFAVLPSLDPRFAPIVADAQKLIQDNWNGTPAQ